VKKLQSVGTTAEKNSRRGKEKKVVSDSLIKKKRKAGRGKVVKGAGGVKGGGESEGGLFEEKESVTPDTTKRA